MSLRSLVSWRTAGIVAAVVLLTLGLVGVLGETVSTYIFLGAVALMASRGVEESRAASQARRNEKAQYLRDEEEKHRARRIAEDQAQTDGQET